LTEIFKVSNRNFELGALKEKEEEEEEEEEEKDLLGMKDKISHRDV